MNTKPPLTLLSCLALSLLAATGPSLRAADSASSGKVGADGVVAAEHELPGQSAQKLIGKDVLSTSGMGLGQVKDLVIDARAGHLVYALVGSGGLLGVGEKIRAVPFAAFKDTYRADGELLLDIDRSTWDRMPSIREAEMDTLLSEGRASTVFDQFGLDWKDESRRMRREADSNESAPKMMRVKRLAGQDVVNAGQQVGKIEDVIVNFESRRATVLLDPNDDYTGSDQKFIIDFNQLSPSLDQPEKLTTVLTRAEFARATPMQRDWWMMNDGYPYIWTGYGVAGGPGSIGAVTGSEIVMGSPADRQPGSQTSRPSISVIRDMAQRDENIRDATRDLSIENEGDTLVVSGSVSSEDVKQQVGERLTKLAIGWQVDNQLSVRGAGE